MNNHSHTSCKYERQMRMPARPALVFTVCCLFFLSVFLLPGHVAHSDSHIIYVDQNATGAADGTSWTNAFTDLQAALATATSGNEIWVAQGLYKPGTTVSDTFQLKDGVALYGGFAGSESARDERDWKAHVTVLSGDIDDNDGTDRDGIVTDTNAIAGTNSYHVVTGSGVTNTAILNGFTVTAGYADGGSGETGWGGGMFNRTGNPTLANISFRGNFAWIGGGMFNYQDSNPILSDVTFTDNIASDCCGGMANWESSPALTNVTFIGNTASTGDAGGMANQYSSPTLTNVAFIGNTASGDGGGMVNFGGSPSLSNITLRNNLAQNDGGGMANWTSNPALTDVTFTGNSANRGGGLYNERSNPTLANTLFSGNVAASGGGMFNANNSASTLTNITISGNEADADGGGIMNSQSSLKINNSILWGNRDGSGIGQSAQISTTARTITVAYSLVQDGVYTGTGNITGDPRFVRNPDDGGDGWGTGNNDDYGDLRLQNDSPAIDTGSNDLLPPDSTDLDGDGDTGEPVPYDLDGQPRVVDHPSVESDGAVVDMGAYERQFIEVHVTSTVDPAEPLPGAEVTYLLQFGNTGSLPAEAVTLTASLPANLIDVTITYSGTEPAQTGNDPYAWSMDELAAGTGGTIRFRGTLEEGLPAGTTLTGTATISTTSADIDESNNRDKAVLTVLNAPPQAQDDTATTPEERPVRVAVLANDSDLNGDLLTISDVGTPGNGTVTIEGAALHYTPTHNFYGTDRVTYTISDGSLTDQGEVTITVTNTNDAPVADDATFSLPENSEDSAVVGTGSASDPDDDPLTFTVTDGNEAGAFAIDADTGEIIVADGNMLDYDATPTHTLTVEVSDGALTDTATITINLDDVNEAPVAQDASFSLPEDSADGAAVGTIPATDPDDDPLTVRIIDGNDKGIFAIDADTGEITVVDGNMLDYDATPTHTLTVEVSDGTLADTATVTIDILEAGGGTGERSGIFLPFLSR